MKYTSNFKGRNYGFADLKDLLAKASPLRSADELAGIAAASEEERAVAQWLMADLPLTTFLAESLIPPEEDEVSRLIEESHDRIAFAPVSSLSVGEFRECRDDIRTRFVFRETAQCECCESDALHAELSGCSCQKKCAKPSGDRPFLRPAAIIPQFVRRCPLFILYRQFRSSPPWSAAVSSAPSPEPRTVLPR